MVLAKGQKIRWMYQNREPRYQFMQIYSTYLWQRGKDDSEKKWFFSINGFGLSEHPYAKQLTR